MDSVVQSVMVQSAALIAAGGGMGEQVPRDHGHVRPPTKRETRRWMN